MSKYVLCLYYESIKSCECFFKWKHFFIFRGDKILTTKLFDDDDGNQWQRSVVEKNYTVVCLSEISLYARFKGGVPSFTGAMPLEEAPQLYQYLLRHMRRTYDKIEGSNLQSLYKNYACVPECVCICMSVIFLNLN